MTVPYEMTRSSMPPQEAILGAPPTIKLTFPVIREKDKSAERVDVPPDPLYVHNKYDDFVTKTDPAKKARDAFIRASRR